MSWFGLTAEERDEWRKHPTTLAFIAAVTDAVYMTRDQAVSAILNSGSEAADDARRLSGKAEGLKEAIRIMESDS